MENGDHIFLTVPEILESIQIDLKQYPAQTTLFRKLVPILCNGNGFVVENGLHEGVWIKKGRKSKPRRLRDDILGDFICRKISSSPVGLSTLSEICQLIFWVKTWQGVHPETGEPGIWLDTEMQNFSCTQCGRCCKTLRYHNECRKEDVTRWRAAGREDILKWVRVMNPGKTGEHFSIWIDPATKKRASICPWLKKELDGSYHCRIHETKPFVCHQYPGTRKHAVMTECEGFS